jgi:hypothetical protein
LDLEKGLQYLSAPSIALETTMLKIYTLLHDANNDVSDPSSASKKKKSNIFMKDNREKKTVLDKDATSNLKESGSNDVSSDFKGEQNIVTQVKEKLIKSVTRKSDADIDITIEDVVEKWDEIVRFVKPFNGHLYAFLEKAHPVKLDGSTVVLEVAFAFHKSVIEKSQNRDTITKAIKSAFPVGLSYTCVVNETLGKRKAVDASDILGEIPDGLEVSDISVDKVDKNVTESRQNDTSTVKRDTNRRKFKPRVDKQVSQAFEGL